ncbi:MAG: universal stress protein [Deltaproteobacteria bacterium]|nr:universal stress protein [Deltaproteobacteria bacterium]
MKILCGIDFSETAGAALEVAVDLCRRAKGELLLAHVYNPPVPTQAVLEASTAIELNRTLRRGIEETLENLALPLREEGLPVSTQAIDGTIPLGMVTLAEDHEADLIVVGSRGGRTTEHFPLGSVADRLVERADRPVLVVRGKHDGFANWARGERNLRVLCGVDLTQASGAAMRWLHTLRTLGPCDITLLHLYWPPVEYARLGLRGRRTFTDADPEVAEIVAREIERRLGELPGEGSVKVHVTPSIGSVSYPLSHWSERQQADLVVIGHHHRGFLSRLWSGSVAHRLLARSEVPVACICEPQVGQALEHMPRYSKVIAALDVDDAASRVLAHAIAMTEPCGEVEVCHVVPGPIRAPEQSVLDDDARDLLRERFEALIPADAEELVQEVRLEVIEGGEPGREIVALAERLGADALVIGAHSRPGRRSLVGSVAEWVLRHSERPVMVVHAFPE